MPGNVAAAAASTVMPAFLAQAFDMSSGWVVDVNSYVDGSVQTKALTTVARRIWTATIGMDPTQLSALRTFYQARKCAEPFYFYFWRETSPPGTVDNTGVSTVGRYTVVFTSEWKEAVQMGRTVVSVQLVEVA